VSTDAAPRAYGFAPLVLTCFLPFAAGYLLSYVFRIVNAIVGRRIASDLAIDLAALGMLTSTYFIGFVLLQIPGGVMLDRYGPRRVQATLLLFAALGAALFALSSSIAMLGIARALIGAGVAMCLMAGFKANTLFWPPERLGTANGVLMAFAGLGGVAGTLPVTWLADAAGWRGVFWTLSAASLAVAALVWFAVPDRRPAQRQDLAAAFADVRRIVTARVFWRVVPLTAAAQAAFQAYHTLWTAPWLVDVGGVAAAAIPTAMLAILLGIIPGYLLSGAVTDRAAARGIDKGTLFAIYTGAFLLLQVALIVVPPSGAAAIVVWIVYVVLGTGSMIGYLILTPMFASELAGRLNAAINLIVFLTAFVAQASIGYLLAMFGGALAGGRPAAHGATLAVVAAIQALAWIWFMGGRRSLAAARPRS
jgi:predicted MFS family arabinose efflux permease